jgi:hypothetical protein
MGPPSLHTEHDGVKSVAIVKVVGRFLVNVVDATIQEHRMIIVKIVFPWIASRVIEFTPSAKLR